MTVQLTWTELLIQDVAQEAMMAELTAWSFWHHQLQPFLILAHTNQQVYGFQETRGHWTSVALGPNELVSQLRGHGHVAVAVTNERALGFSTYTGGFFDIAWTPQERVLSIDGGQNAMVVRTSSRTVIFKSQSNGWTEVR